MSVPGAPTCRSSRRARRPRHFGWIGLYEPPSDLLAQVQARFGLHPLAIEDGQTVHHRPKLERYG
ncbi:hypothetical protein [Methylobacterium oxalidis]|uniref:Uncharacterized protein n=1 Tax=Methylobacterium oxalidis TaxID=944322 RepID=A0A512J7D7_9HYPH|nr:hypothetical protein [Methylobacterium oxalidis]GEP05840.1 hypothetical protein MOX02_38780 [Methylobacterium oxalidis]GLS66453.1 hypothetical protein GCM10007888_48360 [Methylobacterium oxalidis]